MLVDCNSFPFISCHFISYLKALARTKSAIEDGERYRWWTKSCTTWYEWSPCLAKKKCSFLPSELWLWFRWISTGIEATQNAPRAGPFIWKGATQGPGHWLGNKHKVCKKEQGPQPPPTTHVALETLVASNSNGSRMAASFRDALYMLFDVICF